MKEKKETNELANYTAFAFGLGKTTGNWQLVKIWYDPNTLQTGKVEMIYEDPYRDVVMEKFQIEASIYNEVK